MTLEFDFSTFTVPTHSKPRQEIRDLRTIPNIHIGEGCAFDPPGYPTYFLHTEYKRNGNDVAFRALLWNYRFYQVSERFGDKEAALLYKPLPFDNPRVQHWIASVMQHYRSCYLGVRMEYGQPTSEVYKQEFLDKIWHLHLGIRAIHKWYPDFHPAWEAFDHPELHMQADWWERYAEQPSEDECPGFHGSSHDLCVNGYNKTPKKPGVWYGCALCGRWEKHEG